MGYTKLGTHMERTGRHEAITQAVPEEVLVIHATSSSGRRTRTVFIRRVHVMLNNGARRMSYVMRYSAGGTTEFTTVADAVDYAMDFQVHAVSAADGTVSFWVRE